MYAPTDTTAVPSTEYTNATLELINHLHARIVALEARLAALEANRYQPNYIPTWAPFNPYTPTIW